MHATATWHTCDVDGRHLWAKKPSRAAAVVPILAPVTTRTRARVVTDSVSKKSDDATKTTPAENGPPLGAAGAQSPEAPPAVDQTCYIDRERRHGSAGHHRYSRRAAAIGGFAVAVASSIICAPRAVGRKYGHRLEDPVLRKSSGIVSGCG
jgi:hypothetical protein